MAKKSAIVFVRVASESKSCGKHMAYLTDGHQLAGGDLQAFTKGLRDAKKYQDDPRQLVNFWSDIDERFQAAKDDGIFSKRANLIAKQVLISLPNDLSDAEIKKVAQAALKNVPTGVPASLVLHRESNGKNASLHLQGLIGIRKGARYNTNVEDFRLNFVQDMKAGVRTCYKKLGYKIQKNVPQTITNGQSRYLVKRALAEEPDKTLRNSPLLKNPAWLRGIALEVKDTVFSKYLRSKAEQSEKVRMRKISFMNASSVQLKPVDMHVVTERIEQLKPAKYATRAEPSAVTGNLKLAVQPKVDLKLDMNIDFGKEFAISKVEEPVVREPMASLDIRYAEQPVVSAEQQAKQLKFKLRKQQMSLRNKDVQQEFMTVDERARQHTKAGLAEIQRKKSSHIIVNSKGRYEI